MIMSLFNFLPVLIDSDSSILKCSDFFKHYVEISYIHEKTTHIGNPIAINKVIVLNTHSGASNRGKRIDKTCNKTHATNKYAIPD